MHFINSKELKRSSNNQINQDKNLNNKRTDWDCTLSSPLTPYKQSRIQGWKRWSIKMVIKLRYQFPTQHSRSYPPLHASHLTGSRRNNSPIGNNKSMSACLVTHGRAMSLQQDPPPYIYPSKVGPAHNCAQGSHLSPLTCNFCCKPIYIMHKASLRGWLGHLFSNVCKLALECRS